MELTCSRCHQTVEAGNCYCPACGLPQFVYTEEGSAAPGLPEQRSEPVLDAGIIDWKPAMRPVFLLAIPAGIFCSVPMRTGFFGLLLMAATGAWAVALYMRSQRPAWITVGAGARIGLVTGVVGGWAATAVTGVSLYAMRFWLHQGNIFDGMWQSYVNQLNQQWTSMGVDAQTIALFNARLLAPEGRAGLLLLALTFLSAALLVFATVGGALGARFLARRRRPQN
jgi:hypothetical protein